MVPLHRLVMPSSGNMVGSQPVKCRTILALFRWHGMMEVFQKRRLRFAMKSQAQNQASGSGGQFLRFA